MRMTLVGLLVCILTLSSVPAAADSPSGKRPNILLIITDDQGYGDISAHGNPVLQTPNLDRLHQEGVRFTDFHVSPTCAPTRSAIMTSRHEFKNGVTHTILERERMSLQATTLPQVLQAVGYATGIFGKWHLGDEAEYQPNRRGFEEVFIHGGGGIGQIYPGSCGDAPGNSYFNPTLLHNGQFVKTNGYCTNLFFDQAIKWIDQQRQAQMPFFAYVATNTPHSPLNARPEDKAVYEGRGLHENVESFFGMIHNIDQNVGRILAKLDEWQLTDKTLVIFMNDNGGTAGVSVFNAGMRGAKGTAWLGGTRASSFWRWPGTLNPADCGALTAHIDIFPTLAALVGAQLNEDVKKQVEGRSLIPLLENPQADWSDRLLFTHLGRWAKGTDPGTARYRACSVRSPRWHLVSEKGAAEPEWQLFNVNEDIGESTNVADQHPEVVKQLSTAFEQFWQEALPLMVNENARGPRVNPFQELYYQQFGGSPTPEAMALMDPDRRFPEPAKGGKKKR